MGINVGSTNTIIYSWNEGLNFSECIFTNLGVIDISNIVVDPTQSSQSFIVLGIRDQIGGDQQGVLIQIDFTGLHQRQCGDDDYEWWSPSTNYSNSQMCLNGEMISYSRRIRERECYNGRDYDIQTQPQPCPCQPQDYECDYCYERMGSVCGLVTDCELPPSPPLNCNGTYFVSGGYRLIPGNNCNSNLNGSVSHPFTPREVTCPYIDGKGNKNGLTAGMIAVIVIALTLFFVASVVGVIWWMRRKSHQRFQALPEFESTALDEDLLETEAQPLDDRVIQTLTAQDEKSGDL